MNTQRPSLLACPPMYASADLVLIEAVTNLHAGVGRSGGTVDLPVQRDEYGYPCIYSSSIKGALKTALLYAFASKMRNFSLAQRAVAALLGPEPEGGESFESSVAILDAYLLAMPVRSLKGVYAYVTSPLLLKRFADRLELIRDLLGYGQAEVGTKAGEKKDLSKALEAVRCGLSELIERSEALSEDEVLCIGDYSDLVIDELGRRIVLVEEIMVKPSDRESGELCQWLNLDKPLLVLNDDTAKEVISRGLMRLTRVKLSRTTKTVESGGLWTEEYVPVKSRFYTMILYKRPALTKSFIAKIVEKQGDISDEDYLSALVKLSLIDSNIKDRVINALSAGDIVAASTRIVTDIRLAFQRLVYDQLKGYVIVGGHETIGKGIVKLVEFSSRIMGG